jgi:putative transposase
MIDRGSEVSVKRQAELLDVSRASVYYRPRAISALDLQFMRRIDELHLEAPHLAMSLIDQTVAADRLVPPGCHAVRELARRALWLRLPAGFAD